MYIVACAVASGSGLADVRVETIMDPVSFLTKVFPTLPEASKAMEEHCNVIVETVIKDHAMQCEHYPQLEKIPDDEIAHWRHKYLFGVVEDRMSATVVLYRGDCIYNFSIVQLDLEGDVEHTM